MKKIPIIVGNWKMYKTIAETEKYLNLLIPKVESLLCKIIIAPPFTAISVAAEITLKTNFISIAAQNINEHQEGAFTGEVSSKMVKEAGADFVILGHSERRTLFHESNTVIRKKVEHCLSQGLSPILCVGETDAERASGKSHHILKEQIEECLMGFHEEQLKNLIVAYEPIWAIGTGKTATPEIANDAHNHIRETFLKKWGSSVGKKIPILYGGSVKSENISALMQMPHIDGALVGGASLDVEQFAKIISLGAKS